MLKIKTNLLKGVRMKFTSLKNFAVTGLFLTASGMANASLINADYLSAGDGLAVFDSATGKTWLDLSVTAAMAYNDVGIAGYRHATKNEVIGLFNSYWSGISYAADGVFRVTELDAHLPADTWYGLWGGSPRIELTLTGYTAVQTPSYGFYKDESDLLRAVGVFGRDYTDTDSMDGINYNDFDYMSVTGPGWPVDYNPDVANANTSTFLIRADVTPPPVPVPLPGSMLLMTLGLAILGYRRRKGRALEHQSCTIRRDVR